MREFSKTARLIALFALFVLVVLSSAQSWSISAETRPETDVALVEPSENGASRDEIEVITSAMEPRLGDFDAIAESGMLRVAIPYTPIYFSYDGENLIGFAVDLAREMETYLARVHGSRINVILMPLPRDQILPAVIEGRADLAMANLTITSHRQEVVDFTRPIFTGVSELVVTGPAAGKVASFDDLVTHGIYVRKSSSYFSSAQALNQMRRQAGKAPIPMALADERLEDYDLLELLSIGTIPAIIVDSHKMELWSEVFPNVTVHQDLAFNEDGEIAWAMRKDSPELMSVMNGFVRKVREGTLLGNILRKRYLGSSSWIQAIREGRQQDDYEEILALIQEYSSQYDFDWRMILAQAYQESGLEQSANSRAGAVGIMQVLPATAKEPYIGLPNVWDRNDNIHAGVKYLRWVRDTYFNDGDIEPFDEIMFSLAAYNAGPGNIARARRRAERMGLDPDVWFSNVELAAAREISREPVTYVRNIFKYYVSFSLIEEKDLALAEGVGSGAQGPD